MGLHAITKHLLLRGIDAVGIPRLFLLSRDNRATIILYHGVSPEIGNFGIFNYRRKFISPDTFQKQIRWLKAHYNITPLTPLIERLNAGKSFPPRSLAITFDDGYENIYKYAYPILKNEGVPATVFLTTNFVDQKIPLWVDTLEYAVGHTEKALLTVMLGGQLRTFPIRILQEKRAADAKIRTMLKSLQHSEMLQALYSIITSSGKDLRTHLFSSPYRALTWDQAREMQKNGITFGPHTLTHPILSRLPPSQASHEIAESDRRIRKELGESHGIFVYPNGQQEDFNQTVIEILKKLGFRAALTTISGYVDERTDLFQIPRITLDGTDEPYMFRATVTGVRHLLRSFPHLTK